MTNITRSTDNDEYRTGQDRRRESADGVYSDFSNNLTPHPITGDVVRKTDAVAIKESIRNILLTDKYERLYNHSFGAGIAGLLFEPMTDVTARALHNTIINAIESYEPRASIINLNVTPLLDSNQYNISLTFSVINISSEETLEVTLKRVR